MDRPQTLERSLQVPTDWTPATRVQTWKAMEEVYKSGMAKAIGVSNFTVAHLEELRRSHFALCCPSLFHFASAALWRSGVSSFAQSHAHSTFMGLLSGTSVSSPRHFRLRTVGRGGLRCSLPASAAFQAVTLTCVSSWVPPLKD